MKFFALFTFLIISFVSSSQTEKTEIVHYNDTIPYYYFKFEGHNTLFLWDTISKSNNLSDAMFFIENNTTKDILVHYTNYKNKHLRWSGEKNRIIKPGGYYELDIDTYLSYYPRPIRERLELFYTIDGQSKQKYTLKSKGYYDPSRQKSNNHAPIAKTHPLKVHDIGKQNTYDYDITNWNNSFNWGTIDTTKSTKLVTFNVSNPTTDTLYLRSIDMPYEKIFLKAEINGQIITNRTDVNVPLLPNSTLQIRSKILSIPEPIYYFHLPNYINVVYFRNGNRKRFRIKNKATIRNKIKKTKQPKRLKPRIAKINKSQKRKKTQHYKTDIKYYYFNFTDLNQNFDWGKVYISPEINSTVFLIKNNTGKKLVVTHAELKNNFTNWSHSKPTVVHNNAFYEIKPYFYNTPLTESNLKYPLKIKYTTDQGKAELIIKTNINGIYKPQSKEAVLTLREHYKNRKAKVNNTLINRHPDQLDYHYEFNETNYGLNWGDFYPLKNQAVNIYIKNTSNDTVYVSQINTPILNFKTAYYVEKKQILNKEYGYTAVPPHQKLRVSLFAKATRSYTFKFPFHSTLKFFKNGERKVMRIIHSGQFIKPSPIVTVPKPRPEKPIVPKENPLKNYKIYLDHPNSGRESLKDLIFVRWHNNLTDTIQLKHNSMVTLKVKHDEIIYGYFYCKAYGVLSKIRHKVDFKHKTESKEKHYRIIHLFKSRDNYFYAGYGMTYIKQPYKTKQKHTYKLSWEPKNNNRQLYYKEVIKYIGSLGYAERTFVFERDLKKAIALEKKLKHSKYKITMEAVDWQHNLSSEGWGGGYSVYANQFQITFLPGTSKQWIASFFNKYQITDYTVYNQNVYKFKFKYTVSRSFMRILDRMWIKKEVLKIKQFKHGMPDLD